MGFRIGASNHGLLPIAAGAAQAEARRRREDLLSFGLTCRPILTLKSSKTRSEADSIAKSMCLQLLDEEMTTANVSDELSLDQSDCSTFRFCTGILVSLWLDSRPVFT